jgi:hypothetical protein
VKLSSLLALHSRLRYSLLLRCAVANALRLPLANQSIDVVITRSVLIYLTDRLVGFVSCTVCCSQEVELPSSSRSMRSANEQARGRRPAAFTTSFNQH